MPRTLIGLAIGSGLEGVDAALVRSGGIGLDLRPTVSASFRVAFPPALRDAIRDTIPGNHLASTPDLVRNLTETAVHAARQLLTRSGVSARDIFAVGMLKPARPVVELGLAWPEVSDRLAEQLGLTVVHAFRLRDRAAGGAGHPITAVADFLLYTSSQPRLLIHLGAVTSMLLLPPGDRVTGVWGFEAGPGNQLLNALVYQGTRGREANDPGGKKAVQGHCVEPLLEQWLEHPHITRTPPKVVHPDAFGRSFQLAAFDAARQTKAALPDLLCTANHLVARALGDAARKWLAAPGGRQILVSGGGVRNGFLWQLLSQQFPGETVTRLDEAGVGALTRNAAAAAVLAALTCDGVPGNIPALTGATGGRLLGHLTPGDGRNWHLVAAWLADQSMEYPRINRAA